MVWRTERYAHAAFRPAADSAEFVYNGTSNNLATELAPASKSRKKPHTDDGTKY
jgi:hypothetical protein